MTVLDASAVLAFLQGEPGGDSVEKVLESGDAVCGTANWSEVAQKVLQRGADWDLARGLLLSYDLTIDPVGAADAEAAAGLWSEHPHLSLGDRLCLALAARRREVTVTADAAWGTGEGIQQIRPAGST